MNKSTIYIIIIIVFVIGIFGASNLVLAEIKTGNGCPKIGFIPVCYVVLACFVIPLYTHIKKKWNTVYFIGTGIAFLIAIIASVMQFSGVGNCPTTSNGTPMCYYSLLIFFVLISLKIIYLKNNKNETMS